MSTKHKQLRDITRLLLNNFYSINGITIADLKNELLNNQVGHTTKTLISVSLKTTPELTLTTQAMLDSNAEVFFDVQIESSTDKVEFLYYVQPNSVSNAKFSARKISPVLITNHTANADSIFLALPVRQPKI